MKIVLILILAGMAISCNEMDNFRNTVKYFETDKTDYCPGDTIRITAIIASNTEKKVRIFKNYKNLILTIVLKDTCQDNFGEECYGLIPQNIAGREKPKIEEHMVSPRPFHQKNICGISKKSKRPSFIMDSGIKTLCIYKNGFNFRQNH